MWRIPQEILDLHDSQRVLDFVLDQLKDSKRFISKVRSIYAQPEKVVRDTLEFKDGRTFERYSHPQKIDGVTVGRVWTFRDVTERVQAEETLSRLIKIYKGIVAVLSSGYADSDITANYRDYGFSAVLNKPYKIEALRDCLNSLLL